MGLICVNFRLLEIFFKSLRCKTLSSCCGPRSRLQRNSEHNNFWADLPKVRCPVDQTWSHMIKLSCNVNKDEKAIDIQRWTSTVPHSHGVSPKSYGDRGIGDHNYCRCPDYILAVPNWHPNNSKWYLVWPVRVPNTLAAKKQVFWGWGSRHFWSKSSPVTARSPFLIVNSDPSF